PVGAADEPAHAAATRARRGPDDHRAVLSVMMAEDVRHRFGIRILLENEPGCGNLPAAVTELPTDAQPLDIAVELDVADFDRSTAAGDEDHRAVGRRHFREPAAGGGTVHRCARVWVESPIANLGRAAPLCP